MTDELHPLTELLLARLKSHPEEFVARNTPTGRWHAAIDAVRNYGSEEDRAAWYDAVNRINMNMAHEAALDELMNGEERRMQAMLRQRDMMGQSLALSSSNISGTAVSPNTSVLNPRKKALGL